MSAASSLEASPAPIAGERPVAAAFDRVAAGYDREFTDSVIGRLQREAVWRHLDGLFPGGSRILDLGCGTAADAVHFACRGVQVHAVDVSGLMIAEAQHKIVAAGLGARITTQVLAMEEAWDRQSCLSENRVHPIQQEDGQGGLSRDNRQNDLSYDNRQDCQFHFDGAISNFGALNCVPHLRPAAIGLGKLIRPGGHVAIGLISRFCLWEAMFYGLQGRFAKAARRWSKDSPATASFHGSAPFNVYYHAVEEVVRAFRPEFRLRGWHGIGIAVPPTYLEKHARRFPRVTRLAAGFDRVASAWPVCRAAADHTLLLFERECAH